MCGSIYLLMFSMTAKSHSITDANEAVAYRFSESIVIYPITPSSPMAELSDEWSNQKRANLWSGVPAVSLYYYLIVLKQVYLAPMPEGSADTTRAPVVAPVRAVVIFTATAVILGGLFPQQLLAIIGTHSGF